VPTTKKSSGGNVLVISQNESFIAPVVAELKNAGYTPQALANLDEAATCIRQHDLAGVVIDEIVDFVPANEIADAFLYMAPRMQFVAMRPPTVGRPPRKTPAGAHIAATTSTPAEVVKLVGTRGRGRRAQAKPVPKDDLLALLSSPLLVDRKTFLHAAERYYLDVAITAASLKPRLAGAVTGDSIASAYRLLGEHDIDCGLSAGAKRGRRRKPPKPPKKAKRKRGRKAKRGRRRTRTAAPEASKPAVRRPRTPKKTQPAA